MKLLLSKKIKIRRIMVLLIVILVISFALLAILAVSIGLHLNRKRYNSFVSENSLCFRSLKEINSRFTFFPQINYDLSYTYDNEKNYETISCEDYLIYQLQYQAEKIREQIEKIHRNKVEYKKYIAQIKNLQLGNFYTSIGKLKKEKLLKIEKQFCHQTKLSAPTTQFFLTVTLHCSMVRW